MFRRLKCVGLFKVRILQEVATHLRHEENNAAEKEQEDSNTLNVVNRVVRVELDPVKRHAVSAFLLFNLNPIGVVRAHFMQRKNVQNNQSKQHDWQCHHVESKEAVKCDA